MEHNKHFIPTLLSRVQNIVLEASPEQVPLILKIMDLINDITPAQVRIIMELLRPENTRHMDGLEDLVDQNSASEEKEVSSFTWNPIIDFNVRSRLVAFETKMRQLEELAEQSLLDVVNEQTGR